MTEFHNERFPGESDTYRAARNELLAAEIDLRRRVAKVATMRHNLPPGGAIKEDYIFEKGGNDLAQQDNPTQTNFSDLFAADKNTLVVYSFMYDDMSDPCPMCTALLDNLDASAPFIAQRVNMAIVAKAPIKKIRDFARQRGWRNLRLLSSANNSYNIDYVAEHPDGGQIPPLNVFTKGPEGIRHAYCTELLYAKSEPGQHPRHVDSIWPIWNMLDLVPDGRGTDWYPQIR
ncbi:MAG: DUF899 family protein [Alphaproteobacteria bacterium]